MASSYSGDPIYVWLPTLTDHMLFTLEKLSQIRRQRVVAMVETAQSNDPSRAGWTYSASQTVVVEVLPRQRYGAFLRTLVAEAPASIHIFSSLFWRARLLRAFYAVSRVSRMVFLISEPYSPRSEPYFAERTTLFDVARAHLRPWTYRLAMWMFGSRISGIFAISDLAATQFSRAGYPPQRIYRYGYFLPSTVNNRSLRPRSDKCLKLIFVGSLIPRKGPDLLISAVQRAAGRGVPVQADYFGPGNASSFQFDPETNVYRGEIEYGSAAKVIGDYHALVVPSRYDGWGAVVNEAIDAGVPVLCSRYAGAASVVKKFEVGQVFDPLDVDSTAELLQTIHLDHAVLDRWRSNTAAARSALEPSCGAKYMDQVIGATANGKEPTNPWYS